MLQQKKKRQGIEGFSIAAPAKQTRSLDPPSRKQCDVGVGLLDNDYLLAVPNQVVILDSFLKKDDSVEDFGMFSSQGQITVSVTPKEVQTRNRLYMKGISANRV